MDYYWITENNQPYYDVVGGEPERHLPKVYNPACGHMVCWGPALVLPMLEAEIPGIEPYLECAAKHEPISPDEWTTLCNLIAKATSGRPESRLLIVPGMRVGPADFEYTCRKDMPDFMWLPGVDVFSEELVRQLGQLNDVLVYPVSARRKSARRDAEQRTYVEL